MTNEEAIEILKDLWRYEHSEYPEKDIRKALDIAIKALEQEPVLNKIRAEIEQERVGYPPSAGYYKANIKCLQIIDKYRTESEE